MISGPTWVKGCDRSETFKPCQGYRQLEELLQNTSSASLPGSLAWPIDLGRLGIATRATRCWGLQNAWWILMPCTNVQSVGGLVMTCRDKLPTFVAGQTMIRWYCCPTVVLVCRFCEKRIECPQVKPFPAYVGSSVPFAVTFGSRRGIKWEDWHRARLPLLWFQCKHPCRLLTLAGRRCSQTFGRHQKYFEGFCTLPCSENP